MARDKFALVTGASSGLGFEISKFLFYNGFKVIGVSRNPPKEIHPIFHSYFTFDLTFCNSSSRLCEIIREKEIKLNVLINNAGFLNLDVKHFYDDFKSQSTINIFTPYYLSTHLPFDSDFNIINIASEAGLNASPDCAIYGATKAGLIHLTKTLATMFAPGGRVNSISPGYFKTNLVPGELPSFLLETIPLKFEASPAQITPAIEMILHTPCITGSNIVIDGGLSL